MDYFSSEMEALIELAGWQVIEQGEVVCAESASSAAAESRCMGLSLASSVLAVEEPVGMYCVGEEEEMSITGAMRPLIAASDSADSCSEEFIL